jgi:hypothetical protein
MKILTHITSEYHFTSNTVYNSLEYIHQLTNSIKSYYKVDSNLKKVLAVIHFQIVADKAISLQNAPFGGFENYKKLDDLTIDHFLTHILNELRKLKITTVIIKNAPSFYSEGYDFNELLISHKFKSKVIEINHHIDLSENSLIELMHSMEKRKYEKCVQANFLFKQEPASNFDDIFEFISDCRKERNQSLSMNKVDLQKMVMSLPESYLLFSVRDGNKLIAASICIIVNSQVIYNFYPASSVAYNNFSPMVFLVSNIYLFAKAHGFETIDLGTSMLNSQPNKNLVQFKEHIGGIQTQRQIFELNL